MSRRLVMLGPPGAGKGTQAARLAEALGAPAISTGDIFRANVAAATELGRTAQQYLDAGDYVPDDVTNAMVEGRLAEPDAAGGFVLDGYPRTAAQVAELDRMLGSCSLALDAVVELTVPTDVIVQRLLKRATEQGRADDTADVIRHRIEVYTEQTAPLAEHYRGRGLLVPVTGLGELAEVTDRLLAALGLSSRPGAAERATDEPTAADARSGSGA